MQTLPHLVHPKYRADIDGLRAVAILAVITFHTFPTVLPGGFIGVDIFLVISGFLISTIIFSSLERDRFSLAEFYIRRIRRIFPALILVLATCLALGWYTLFAHEYKQLGKQTAAGAGFIQNFILLRESGYFDNAAETKPLVHLWSLAIEEQFYIFWPLLLAFVWRRRWGFIGITSAIAIFSFSANIYLISVNRTAAFYLPMSRFWELMLGGMLAFASLHRPNMVARYKNCQSICGLLLLLMGFVLVDRTRDFPGWWALLPTLGAALILSAGEGWLNEKLLANKFMVWVGLISYPLYLWHWPLLSYLKIVEGDTSWFKRGGALGLGVVLAWLTNRCVETPFRFGGNAIPKAGTLLVILFVIGSIGAYGFGSGGFRWRQINGFDVVKGDYDFALTYRLGQCFLRGELSDHYAAACDGDFIKKPTVVIWGDSHAASMYRGLLKQSSIKQFNLAQYNTSGCPPVFYFDVNNRKGCKALNAFVLNKLKILQPTTVVLAANWLLYNGKYEEAGKTWNYLSDENIGRTLAMLKSLGISDIIVVGQLPIFNESQTRIGVRTFIQHSNNRTFNGFNPESRYVDDRIRKVAIDNHVSFVSPIEVLCNNSGCLISTSFQSLIPLAWDQAHLTTDGSEYFIERWPEKIGVANK